MGKTQGTVIGRIVAVMVAVVMELTAMVGTVTAAETGNNTVTGDVEVPTSKVFKLYNDPERDLKLTARNMNIIVSGNLYTLWSYHSSRAPDNMEDKPFVYLGLRMESRTSEGYPNQYFPTNGAKITPTSYPQHQEIRGKNSKYLFTFENVPDGEYKLRLEITQSDFSMFSFNHNIRVSDSSIEFVFSENYAIHKARIDSYEPPVGQQYLTEQSDTIKAKAAEITKGITDPYEKAKTIHLWMAANITHGRDNYGRDLEETLLAVTADFVLEHRSGVCGDFSVLTVALLNAVDIPARVIKSHVMNHAWNEAFVDNRWITMDTSSDSSMLKSFIEVENSGEVRPPERLPEESIPISVSLRMFDITNDLMYGYNSAIDITTHLL